MNKAILGAIAIGFVVTGWGTTDTSVAARTQDPKEGVEDEQARQARVQRFDDSDTRIRSEFAVRLKEVVDGLRRKEVIALLGEPDGIKIIGVNEGYVPGDEVWSYGAPDKDELAILGTVIFRGGTVLWKFGTSKPDPNLPKERELRALLRFMDKGAPGGGSGDDPLHEIRVANRLILLGKEKTIAVVNEFADVGGGAPAWLYWIVQILFEVPDDPGYMRPPRFGAYDQQLQQGTRVPRFPTVLIDDVPVTMFVASFSSGVSEPISRYLEEIGTADMRTELLRPTDDPFASLEGLWQSDQWPFPFEPQDDGYGLMSTETQHKAILVQQALNLVRTVYRASSGIQAFAVKEDTVMVYFKECRRAFDVIGAVWNEEQQMYTLKDGSAPYPVIEALVWR